MNAIGPRGCDSSLLGNAATKLAELFSPAPPSQCLKSLSAGVP